MNREKDSVEMICSLGELAGLFERSTDLSGFLQIAVSIIAYHMKSAVASIYLFDENENKLVLRGTQGLSFRAIGKISLQLGEGLVGNTLKEMQPIRVDRASESPNYKHFPDIDEEKFESFLAVPITHGLCRVGVLVVQDPAIDYYNENDASALKAIAAQLASTIENVELLMSLRQEDEKAGIEPERMPLLERSGAPFIKGNGAAGGIAFGRAVMNRTYEDMFLAEDELEQTYSLEQFEQALSLTEEQLERMQNDMEEQMMDVVSLIFNAQLLMLKDRNFSGTMRDKMSRGASAPRAIVEVVNEYIALFSKSENARLREKIQDLKDLGLSLLHNLQEETEQSGGYDHCIIVGRDILPSDILKFTAQRACGFIMLGGVGVTAHVAILARSLEMPMIIIDQQDANQIQENTPLLLDAKQGHVFVWPSEDVLRTYRPLLKKVAPDAVAESDVDDHTVTADGLSISLMANINLVSDLALANRYKAQGVGLYRSEFPFIIRTDFPAEQEQYPIYCRILDEMDGQEVIFRTLDIGGDKMLEYFPHMDEANPFLGLRAIRFSLRYKKVFTQQLRALLRAGAGRDLAIMFPLVASVDDFLQARDVVHECLEQLTKEGREHNVNPRLGIMVELPSMVEVIDEVAREVDFLSIGSNDLIQYMLAVDRTNHHISDLYMSGHPAVLRTLNRVARAAEKYNIPLSLCGDMATEKNLLPFLIGIGIHKLSMDPHAIPGVQKIIQAIHSREARAYARKLLRMGTIREIQEVLDS